MKASELRIGNLVWLKSKSMPYVISSGHDIEEIDDAPEGFDATPIELTEEWLLKFGFEKVKGGISFDKGKLSIYLGDTILSGKNGRTYFNSWAILEESPKYIHQLQNLWFALTGEELIFNTNKK